jgi:hypothetical protein
MASLAVCLTLPTKLPSVLFDELRVLEKVSEPCEDRIPSGEGSGRFLEVMVAVMVKRNSAEEYLGNNQ